MVFNRATEGHAALVFLLTAGFDGAIAFFVRLSHFESPKACTGALRCTLFMTTWRRWDDRGMNADWELCVGAGLLAIQALRRVCHTAAFPIASKPAPTEDVVRF